MGLRRKNEPHAPPQGGERNAHRIPRTLSPSSGVAIHDAPIGMVEQELPPVSYPGASMPAALRPWEWFFPGAQVAVALNRMQTAQLHHTPPRSLVRDGRNMHLSLVRLPVHSACFLGKRAGSLSDCVVGDHLLRGQHLHQNA